MLRRDCLFLQLHPVFQLRAIDPEPSVTSSTVASSRLLVVPVMVYMRLVVVQLVPVVELLRIESPDLAEIDHLANHKHSNHKYQFHEI